MRLNWMRVNIYEEHIVLFGLNVLTWKFSIPFVLFLYAGAAVDAVNTAAGKHCT